MLIDRRIQQKWLSYFQEEFRTPINAIIGYSELLLEDIKESKEKLPTEEIEKIYRCGQEILYRVEYILSPTTLEKTNIKLEPAFIQLSDRLEKGLSPPIHHIINSCNFYLKNPKCKLSIKKDIGIIHKATDTLLKNIKKIQKIYPSQNLPLSESNWFQSPNVMENYWYNLGGIEQEKKDHLKRERPEKILGVVHKESEQNFLTDELQKQGYEVHCVNRVQEALETLKREQYDLILLDIIIPGANGDGVLKTLKGNENWQNIPVMMMVALDEMDRVIQCLELGAVDYLAKPLNSLVLKARVGMYLEKKRLQAREALHLEQLSEISKQLKSTQNQLVNSEKLAALGRLVAGITHEINNPLGIALMGVSNLKENTIEFKRNYKQTTSNTKKARQQIEEFIEDVQETSQMLSIMLERTAELVKSFKQVSVDQTGESKRVFNVQEYLKEILISLRPHFKHTQHKIKILGNHNLTIESYPGVLFQVVTNLLLNASIHGFTKEQVGLITLEFEQQDNRILLRCRDNGKGIPPENLEKIFIPFFTTKRNEGGSGLGLHLVSDLVQEKLQGTIQCESEMGEGTIFTIQWQANVVQS